MVYSGEFSMKTVDVLATPPLATWSLRRWRGWTRPAATSALVSLNASPRPVC